MKWNVKKRILPDNTKSTKNETIASKSIRKITSQSENTPSITSTFPPTSSSPENDEDIMIKELFIQPKISELIEQNKTEEAIKLTNTIKSPEIKDSILGTVSLQFAKKKNFKEAFAILEKITDDNKIKSITLKKIQFLEKHYH